MKVENQETGFLIFNGNAQHFADDGLTGEQSVACLLDIIGFRIIVHIISDFVHARQRMQDAQVLATVFQHVILQYIHILYTFVFFEVGETFALYTSHVQNIRLVDDVFRKFGIFVVFDAMFVAEVRLVR